MNTPACHLYSGLSDPSAIQEILEWHLPAGEFRFIFIKPNWVRHEENPAFPLRALVSSTALLEALVRACLRRYPQAECITIGDVPLQSCDWNRLSAQAGLDRLSALVPSRPPALQVLDLRREHALVRNGFLRIVPNPSGGDPRGYRQVILDHTSLLDPVCGARARFRVSDYDPRSTVSSHRPGYHRYLIAASALNADLFINVPKLKTHQKAGLTGALKNLVGIVGDKSALVHHRDGGPTTGGDAFPPGISPWIVLQTRIRDRLQGRHALLFSASRSLWQVVKRLRHIETDPLRSPGAGQTPYIGAGSWYGNDSIWRMVYDLNRIIRYAPAFGGELCPEPQRTCVTILDAMVAGEGNGPLQPQPVDLGLLAIGEDPFAVDWAMARLMGFDPFRIPLLRQYREFHDPQWGHLSAGHPPVMVDGHPRGGPDDLAPLRNFLPPPGWCGHIEAGPGFPRLPAEVDPP